jgi:proline iminopeptidase
MEDGLRLFATIVGPGTPSLVVPGRFIVRADYQPLAHGRTVLFYDMRNRGASDPVPDSTRLTIDQDVRDLETIRRHFSIERMQVMGISCLGLMVAMYAAQHPDRIDRVVQVGPVPMRFGTEYPAQWSADDGDHVVPASLRTRLAELRAEQLHVRDPIAYCLAEWEVSRLLLVGDPVHAHRAGTGACHLPNEWPINLLRHLRFHFGSVQALDLAWTEFATVTMPVLTIHGTRDRNAPYGGGREWASRLPDARLITVEGAAHRPIAEYPDIVLGAVETFLRGTWPSDAAVIRSGQ